ncbi:MAG: M48 family metallopeptidase [Deltaproteobacteria bacterium]|jgi:predicted Zn-dependent protease|nr:M48 family metallopeptidase [Deltaproteobacteria bacterium]
MTSKTPKILANLCLALALAVLLAACAPVVGTGRSQLNLANDAELNQVAALQYKKLLGESHLSKDRKGAALLKKVGARISQASNILLAEYGRGGESADYQWEFNLIESDEVNAFCMPGGKVAFYTGIMPICETEAGIAAVMGHEVAHALAKHSNERYSQQKMAGIGAAILNIGLGVGGASSGASEAAMTAFALGSQFGVLLPFSRLHEAEADRIGMNLMALAGYDPKEALKFWQRMEAKSGGGSAPYFLSTHPSDQQRIKNLEKFLPEAEARYQTASTGAKKP